jgi:hypothetical protein
MPTNKPDKPMSLARESVGVVITLAAAGWAAWTAWQYTWPRLWVWMAAEAAREGGINTFGIPSDWWEAGLTFAGTAIVAGAAFLAAATVTVVVLRVVRVLKPPAAEQAERARQQRAARDAKAAAKAAAKKAEEAKIGPPLVHRPEPGIHAWSDPKEPR